MRYARILAYYCTLRVTGLLYTACGCMLLRDTCVSFVCMLCVCCVCVARLLRYDCCVLHTHCLLVMCDRMLRVVACACGCVSRVRTHAHPQTRTHHVTYTKQTQTPAHSTHAHTPTHPYAYTRAIYIQHTHMPANTHHAAALYNEHSTHHSTHHRSLSHLHHASCTRQYIRKRIYNTQANAHHTSTHHNNTLCV